jgi:hypothetical protein
MMKQEIHLSSLPAPGLDWQTILSINDHPAVAIRESPARQVWVGFASDVWPRSSDFVIFWTNVFDWIGQVQSGSRYTLQSIGAVPPAPSTATDWQASRDVRDVTSAFFLASIAIIFVAAMAWATCKNCASG